MNRFTTLSHDIKSWMTKAYNNAPRLGYWCELPAGWIDRKSKKNHTNIFTFSYHYITTRLIYAGVFFPLAVMGTVTAFVAAGYYKLNSFWGEASKKQLCSQQASEYWDISKKNLIAVMFAPLGLIAPRLVSFFFVPEKKHLNKIISGGKYYQASVEIKAPKNIEEIQSIVKSAAVLQQTVMAVGAGFSQGKQYITDDGKPSAISQNIILDMQKFNSVIIDKANKLATVGGGAKWYEIQTIANQHSLALKVMQASNVFSVGGSISTNIHGWDHKTGTLANTLRSVTIVDADGKLRKLLKNDANFKQVVGGLGLSGIIVQAEIELTDNELLEEKSKAVAIRDYPQYFEQSVLPDQNIRMHLYRLSLDPSNLLKSGVAVNYTKTDGEPVITPNFHQEAKRGTRLERVLINIARNFSFARKWYWQYESDRLLKKFEKMTTNQIMQPPINAMFNNSETEAEWLQEYFVPGDNLDSFLENLGDLLMKNKVPLINGTVRFVKQDRFSNMAYAKGEDRFAVVICYRQMLDDLSVRKAKQWIRESYDLALAEGGTFYLPYQQFATQEQFEKSYPQAQHFYSRKNQLDPKCRFNSGFCQQYLAPKRNHYKAILQDERLKKQFTGFLNNIFKRVDADKFYTLMDDILTYADTNAEIYAELSKRSSEIMPSVMSSTRRILNSLTDIKHDLGAQAKVLMHDVTHINGLVEIGYPGRFVSQFKQDFNIAGPITAVLEQESVTDYIQTGFPRPYNHFVPLNYNTPDLSSIPDNSADCVTCYVGLHHVPEDKLDDFILSIKRILKEGGSFLLVDHDADNQVSKDMACLAHSVFNAINGVSVEEEAAEIRNFQSMHHWKCLLVKHGLEVHQSGPDLNMVREGDPSRNTMVRFVKKVALQNEQQQAHEVAAKIISPALNKAVLDRKVAANDGNDVEKDAPEKMASKYDIK